MRASGSPMAAGEEMMSNRVGSIYRAARGLTLIALVATMAGLQACTVNPATGQRSFTAFMSPDQERRVGRQQDPMIREQLGGRYDDEPLHDYVDRVGQALAANAELPDIKFTFTVLNAPDVNAFALPGGFIYVTRGLIALADSEAQLAGVLAHEIGHVTARHAAQRYSLASVAQLGGMLLRATDVKGVGEAFDLGGQIFLSSYSRDQEFEADTLGIRYLSRAGYDPTGVPQFLAKLREHAILASEQAGNGQDPDQFQLLGTHPRTIDRVDRAMKAALVKPDQGGRVGTEAFLRRVNGLLYGPDPAKGEIRGQTFIQHVAGYRFSAPDGYRMQAANGWVLIQGPDNVQASVEEAPTTPGVTPERYLTGVWAPRTRLSGLERLNINGLDAATAALNARTARGPVELRLVAVRLSPKKMLRFKILMPARAVGRASVAMRRLTYSLETIPIVVPDRLPAARIAIHRVQPGETVAALSRSPNRSSKSHSQAERAFRVLNGLAASEEPSTGTLVKLIETPG